MGGRILKPPLRVLEGLSDVTRGRCESLPGEDPHRQRPGGELACRVWGQKGVREVGAWEGSGVTAGEVGEGPEWAL